MVSKRLLVAFFSWFLLVAAPAYAQQTSVPVAEVQTGQEVRVTDFGALPDDGRDDTQAVIAAVSSCRKLDRPTLVFPKGRYDFFAGANPGDSNHAIVLDRLANLTIDGQGSTLVFHGITGCFLARACQALAIRNLAIDWDRPPFSQGKVLSVTSDHKGFDIQIDAAYPVTGKEPIKAFMEYDPQTRLPLRAGVEAYDAVAGASLVRPQLLRVRLSRPVLVKPGVLLVLRHVVYAHNAFDLVECSNVEYDSVAVYTCPGMGLWARNCQNIRLSRVQIRPGSGRPMSTTADATHFNTCKGTIDVFDCLFEGMGDDALNACSFYYTVTRRFDARMIEVRCEKPGRPAPRFDPGDRLEFSRPNTLIPHAEAVVRSASVNPQTGAARIEFQDPLPPSLFESDLVANVSWVPRLHVSRCTVRGNRARGFLIQVRDALVENNLFQNCSGAGIHVTCDARDWFEAMATRRVVIRNNTFEGCNNGAAKNHGVISVFALLRRNTNAPTGVHRDVLIERNTIRDTDSAGLFVSSVDGAVLRNNLIQNCCRRSYSLYGTRPISLMNARNVQIIDNVCAAATRSFTSSAVFFGNGCERESIDVKDTNCSGPN
jgi:hypothetical protein